MKTENYVILKLFFLVLLLVFRIPVQSNELNGLNEKQKIRLLKDIIESAPFLTNSSDVQLKKFTLGKFFNEKIYKKLKGNDILGYEFDGGFRNESDTVFIRSIRTTEKTLPFRAEFFNSLKNIIKRKKIMISRSSPTEIAISLLDVEKTGSASSMPGALVEVYFKNRRTGKYFYYRFGTGKRSGYQNAFSDIWSIIFSILESLK